MYSHKLILLQREVRDCDDSSDEATHDGDNPQSINIRGDDVGSNDQTFTENESEMCSTLEDDVGSEYQTHTGDESELGDTYEETGDKALVELWVLTERLLMPCAQNLGLKAIHKNETRSKMVAIHTIPILYQNTSADSLLRSYYVWIVAHTLYAEEFKKKPYAFPHEFLIDLAESMRGFKTGDHPMDEEFDLPLSCSKGLKIPRADEEGKEFESFQQR